MKLIKPLLITFIISFLYLFLTSCSAKGNAENETYQGSKNYVISKIHPNKLNVKGNRFLIKANPVGEGCFVYDSRTDYDGVKRYLVWWAPSDKTAYPLNSPSKMVTPDLNWAYEDGYVAPQTTDVIEFIFNGKPLPDPKITNDIIEKPKETFTVKEYNIYRAIMDTPMSVSEEKAFQNTSIKYGTTIEDAKKAFDKVQQILFRNNWYSSPKTEIKHASDWKE